jgi:hypothetical protein
MSEQHRYELEIKVSAHNQPDAYIRREYATSEKASTDGAAGEIWSGVSDDIKARCHPVNDGG